MCSWFKPDIPAPPPVVIPPRPPIAAQPRKPTAPKNPASASGSDAASGHATTRRVGAGGGLASRRRNPLN